jgi:hypothetical protein
MSDNNDDGHTSVSMKQYVDSRFEAVKIATDTALTAQKEAVAAALAAQKDALATALTAQKEAVAAQIGNKHDRGLGRQEIFGYVMGAVGILSLIVTVFLLFHK